VRMRAIWALGSVEPKSAPPALIAALKDSNPRVRELAAWALYSIQDPAAVPALNAALKSETSQNLQLDYIRALGALGEKSVDAVRELLLSSDPRIKSMAVRALAGGNGAGPWPWPWPEPRPYP
jgi:HEAT repeat protein